MSDPWVLNAQRWVNATYDSVAQIPRVEEDGQPGWSTANALIMALQHELGIEQLADEFGDGTMARLTAFGTLSELGPKGDRAQRQRIIKVMQAAMYCKGYDGGAGEIDGVWTPTTTSGVQELRANIGLLPDPAEVTPKLFKALLNMDAYVLVENGQVAIRAVQRELNGRYVPTRREFYVIPADGHYSRDVQSGLMYAIQYTIGMDDDTANGYFGPGTQAGVREQGNFGEGETGSFLISLFQAALIFNGYSIPFTRVFDKATADATRDFQAFCHLEVTGRSDFQTWASLLVSTGDPSRPATACDASKEITPARARTLVSAGYFTVGRYLTNTPVPDPLDKKIKPGELQTIFQAGMSVFPIFQEGGFDRTYFGYEKGRYAAKRAHEAAAEYGFLPGTIIYFAVDFDAIEDQVHEIIVPHFRGIRDGLHLAGSPYRVGVYGARNTCRIVSDHGLADLSFVSGMSTGYSGNLGYPLPENWAFDQVLEYDLGGEPGTPSWLDIDKDIQSGRDNGQVEVIQYSYGTKLDTIIEFIDFIERVAVDFIRDNPTESRTSSELACRWLRNRSPSYSYEPGDSPGGLLTALAWGELGGLQSGEFRQLLGAMEADGRLIVPDALGGKAPFEYVVGIDWLHAMATLSAYQVAGSPSRDIESPERSDFGGWAGDALTLLFDLHAARQKTPPLVTPAKDWAAKALTDGFPSSFGSKDVASDAFAWLVAQELDGGETSLASAIRTVTSRHSSRDSMIGAFGRARWGTIDHAIDCARVALNPGGSNVGYVAFRSMFVLGNDESDENALSSIPATDRNGVADAVAERFFR